MEYATGTNFERIALNMAENGQLAEEYHPQRTPAPSPARRVVNNSIYTINLKLLPIKLFYLVFMAAVGVLLPFVALYMMHLKLSSKEIGIIYGVMPFVGFFIRPLIGAVADKFKKHKLTLMIVTVLTGVFYFLLILVPGRSRSIHVQVLTAFKCNTEDSYVSDCYRDAMQPSCQGRLSLQSFVTLFKIDSLNQSVTCNFSCLIAAKETVHEFRACFTDNSGSYEPNNCNGTLNHGKHLNFTIPSLPTLIHRNTSASDDKCLSYDVKNIEFENKVTHQAFQILCESETDLDCIVSCPKFNQCETEIVLFDSTFYFFFFLFLLANIAFAPIFPILDASAYEALGEKPNHWGMQRAWGTFGFAVSSVTIMLIKQGQIEDFAVFFYIFLPLCIVSTFIAFFLPISSDIKCGQFVHNVFQLLSYAKVSTFLFVVMYFGILTGALEAFLFVYLFGIGADSLVLAVELFVQCTSELIMLFTAGFIIKKLGLVNCLYLTLFCYALRFLVISLISNPWYVLITEPLYGICFGLMYAAASSYASIIAPPGMSATIQGLLGGVHFGFGKGIGSLITGFMFDSIGATWTWRAYCISSVLLLIGYFILNKTVFTGSHQPPTSTNKAATAVPDEQTRQKENLIKDQNETMEVA
ncbi:major facilitator superfamily domain-containing protein 6-A-like isoform X1 [Biomphalaria glabrata]|uniref:Major facilitator superfamily domain-containing protein 6-A-like isoform X1 n=1 Tax=Biomphalaria glabrata TaxID=6526 RepID=A0A9W3B4J7_BIOGL|nr:major facilitator superfamily domain-containing protein 6-A-like isoform X1 [Biomphalaria glabrata]